MSVPVPPGEYGNDPFFADWLGEHTELLEEVIERFPWDRGAQAEWLHGRYRTWLRTEAFVRPDEPTGCS